MSSPSAGTRPELVENGLARMATGATKMNALISEMLDFARLQAGQSLELFRRQTDLVALARQVTGGYSDDGTAHNIKVIAPMDQLVGLWDAPRLERVLDNLLSNSIKYSPKGGDITVELRAETCADRRGGSETSSEKAQKWAVFAVRDQGIGIPDSDLPYIFEWFRRAANVSGRISGTGIGLASARQVVEQHGGTISVESQEGVGSTFTVRLPVD